MYRKIEKIILSFVLWGASILLIYGNSWAQYNHPYPRNGVFHFYGGRPEIYAKYDLVMTTTRSNGLVANIKAINPNAIVVLAVIDWNTFKAASDRLKSEWYVRDSNGDRVKMSYGYLIDMTDYCPRVNTNHGYLRYNEYLSRYMEEVYNDYPSYDGIMSHGVWDHPYGTTDVDLDGNGVNDWDEHGRAWLESKWLAGVDRAAKDTRTRIGEDKIFIMNSGRLHTFNWEESNGIFLEKQPATYGFKGFIRNYYDWMNAAPSPHVFYLDGTVEHKNQFDGMRYMMAVTMIGDGYYACSERASENHRWSGWYDEMDLDLGYPTSAMIELVSYDNNGEGLYVRFFDKGCVIMNSHTESHTVSDIQLRDLSSYYDGPYYHFRGGQRPAWNNGQQFSSVTLSGRTYGSKGTIGDAIFLLKAPLNVVSEIVIDNDDQSGQATSPGSQPTEYTGAWQKMIKDISDYYAWFVGSWMDCYGLHYALPGDGSRTATFRPTIGVSGPYQVYEWHGSLDGTQEASNAPYEIRHAGGTSVGIIDQSKNHGKWNYIGTYNFVAGTSGYLKISNNANGVVIADAVKFVFDENAEVDATPPNTPRNLRSDSQTESSISLAWDPPQQAPDGDYASSYKVNRGDIVVGYTFSTFYTDVGLSENSLYNYTVYALDDFGNMSINGATGSFSTLPDQTPPTVDSVRMQNSTLLSIVFNEPVDINTATNINNYSITNNIQISSANLLTDLQTVQLTTSKHVVGTTYYITINNVLDKASNPNAIEPNTTASYLGVGDPVIIKISADNNYWLYVNGEYLGTDTRWQEAETYYYFPTQLEKVVVAVKCSYNISTGGLVTEITNGDDYYVTNQSWQVSTVEQAGWQTLDFNDQSWQQATSYGLHGEAQPWAQYGNVSGISTTNNVEWIWSSDNQNDQYVWFRFVINEGADQSSPSPPTGVTVIRK
ncbi:MAG: putative glycoside hydrolase [bacterium]|nr:putative glycoside hydrolase [bacterium]